MKRLGCAVGSLCSLKQTYALILAFAVLRAVSALYFDLGVDEAHYALYAHFLDLSYFDHPPLVGWTHFIFIHIFGDNLFGLRISAILLSAILSLQIYRLLKNDGFSENAIFWGVFALNSSFIIDALSVMLLPDSLLIVIMLAIIFSVQKLQKELSFKNYVWLGFLFGLAGLAKYSAFLILISIVLYLTHKRRFDIFFNYKIIFAILTAIIIITPVIYWNYEHNFASFTYQGAHVAGNESWSLKKFTISLGRQFGAYAPPLFIIAFYGFYKRFKSADLSVFIGAITLAFFWYTQGLKDALPHWTAPFFALFIPIGAALLAQNGSILAQKTLKISVWICFIIVLALHLELIFKLGAFPNFKSPFQDIYGWDKAGKKAKELLTINKAEALAVPNWTMASRIAYYSNLPTVVLQDKATQFDYWAKPAKKLIVVTDNFSNLEQNKCTSLKRLSDFNASLNGGVVNSFTFYYCERP